MRKNYVLILIFLILLFSQNIVFSDELDTAEVKLSLTPSSVSEFDFGFSNGKEIETIDDEPAQFDGNAVLDTKILTDGEGNVTSIYGENDDIWVYWKIVSTKKIIVSVYGASAMMNGQENIDWNISFDNQSSSGYGSKSELVVYEKSEAELQSVDSKNLVIRTEKSDLTNIRANVYRAYLYVRVDIL